MFIYLISIIISSHLHLVLPNSLFSSTFWLKSWLYSYVAVRAICAAHRSFLGLMTLTICYVERLWARPAPSRAHRLSICCGLRTFCKSPEEILHISRSESFDTLSTGLPVVSLFSVEGCIRLLTFVHFSNVISTPLHLTASQMARLCSARGLTRLVTSSSSPQLKTQFASSTVWIWLGILARVPV
jgi:hypothetical protein